MNDRLDLASGIAYIASGTLTTVAIGFGDAFPTHAKQIIAIAGGVTLVAGLLTRLWKNPSPPPGTQPVLEVKDPK